MRSLQNETVHAETQRRNYRILGILLIVLMVGSSLGYAFSLFGDSKQDSSSTDNEPYFDGARWVITVGGSSFYLTHGPSDVTNVSIEGAPSLGDFAGKTAYVASEDKVAQQMVLQLLSQYAERVQAACYGPCEDSDLPEKNCAEALVVIRSSSEPRIWKDQSCTFLEGDVRTAEAYIYYLLGYL